VYFHSFAESKGLGHLKETYSNTSIFSELICVPTWSHAAENRSNACWRPGWEDPHMQYQFVRKKQTVHLGVLISDTLVDASVTVCAIYIDQWSSNFLEEDHISHCTTIREPHILCNVIFSGYVTFYQINTFYANIFFIIGKMCFPAGWNGFASRICSAGRSVENPDIDYEEEWWQHTPLSEYSTNAERLWFNSIDQDTIFLTGI